MNSLNTWRRTLQSDFSLRNVLPGLPFVLLVGFFLYHWWVVYKWAVDIPYWDEWDNLLNFPVTNWLLTPHNEHRIFTTKLVVLGLWPLTGGSYISQQVFNFAFFGAVLAGLGYLLRAAVRSMPGWCIALLLMYCLSPMNQSNHSWGFQIQWHFTLFYLFGCVYFWFNSPGQLQSGWQLALGTLCGLLCMYSLSAGIMAMGAVVLLFGVFKFQRGRQDPTHKVVEWRQFFLFSTPLLVVLAHFLLTFHSIPRGNPAKFVFDKIFWDHFLIMIGNCTGVMLAEPYAQIAGLFILSSVSAPWIWIVLRRRNGTATPPNLWCIAGVILGLLAALAAISTGRASLGINQAFAFRYREFTMMLIPLGFAMWWCALDMYPRLRSGFLVVFLTVAAGLFVNSFQYFSLYEMEYHQRIQGVQYVRVCYFSSENTCPIPELYPRPIRKEWLTRAQKLNYSFVRQLRQ